MELVPTYRVLAAKSIHEHGLLGAAKGNTEGFDPLKVVLGKILALFADRTVRARSQAAWNSLLTQFSGISSCGEQGCKPPSTYSRIGGTFRFTSKWRAGAETPR